MKELTHRNLSLNGLGIDELLALVIPENHALGIFVYDVFRIEGNFAAASWPVDHVLRDAVAGGVAAETFDDFEALIDSGAEMLGALDEIGLIKVVGADAAHEEFMDEVALDLHRVVDVLEKD